MEQRDVWLLAELPEFTRVRQNGHFPTVRLQSTDRAWAGKKSFVLPRGHLLQDMCRPLKRLYDQMHKLHKVFYRIKSCKLSAFSAAHTIAQTCSSVFMQTKCCVQLQKKKSGLKLLEDNSWEASVGVAFNDELWRMCKIGPQSWWSGLGLCRLVIKCRNLHLKIPSSASEISLRGNCSCSLDTSRLQMFSIQKKGSTNQADYTESYFFQCDLCPDWVWHPCLSNTFLFAVTAGSTRL